MSVLGAVKRERYDPTTIALHWLVAFGVIFQWLGAHAIDLFPRGPLRIDARSFHIVVGATLLALLLWRFWWRNRHGVRFEPDPRPALALGAHIGHAVLYLLLLSTLLLGLADAWVRGDSLFGLFHIPAYGGLDKAARHALANRIVSLHELSANALLWLAGAHGLVALAHHLILRDDVLARMTWLQVRSRRPSPSE